MISVLTVSRRTGWEEIAVESLRRQTLKEPYEWIVVSENELEIPYIQAPPQVRQSNLNASLNEGLRNCKGEYVIFYQDFIDLPPDCFQKLFELAGPTTFVTTLTLNADGSDDLRGTVGGPVKECIPEQWEANVAIAPMGIIKYLGGFDEEYDNGWSWDNVNLAVRAAKLGCNFLIDQSNNPQLFEHDRTEIKEMNGAFHTQRITDIEEGRFPLRLEYL